MNVLFIEKENKFDSKKNDDEFDQVVSYAYVYLWQQEMLLRLMKGNEVHKGLVCVWQRKFESMFWH